MDKTLIIVLDEFSERVLDYGNVTLFDYGFLNEFTEYDFANNGYGSIDQTEATFTDISGGFYEVTPDNIDYSFERDIDLLEQTTVQTQSNGEALAYSYTEFVRVGQGSEVQPNHGDWVVEAITQSLDDPSRTDILAIDVDLDSDQYLNAFETFSFQIDGQSFTEPALVLVLIEYLMAYDATFNSDATVTYLPTALTVSLGDISVTQQEIDTLEYFESRQVAIFQASANEGQGGVDWGAVYPTVINVGAWNLAENGEFLLSSFESLPNVDLAGDGIVERQDWGTEFGTSFATPRIAAEFTNLANDLVADLNASGGRLSDFTNATSVPPAYAELVEDAIPALTTDVEITFADVTRDTEILQVSDATIAQYGLEPDTLMGAATGLAGSETSNFVRANPALDASIGDDVLEGGGAIETIAGLAGDDTLEGAGANDFLDGGSGMDTALYSGSQNSYSLLLMQNVTTLVDRRADGNGSDRLIEIEFLDFDTTLGEGPYALNLGLTGVSAADFESFIELYIAYFNRAPDAMGLNFWGTAFANGTSLEQMATFFINQEETRATYPTGTSNTEFATTVYSNVLGRTPDQDGIDFWVGELDSGRVSRDQFILEALRGAKSELKPELGQAFVDQQLADRAYLENKVDLGALFAVHYGMSDVQNAASVMALYDGSQSSIAAAVAAIDGHYQDALDPTDGAFLMQVIGVLDNPFAA